MKPKFYYVNFKYLKSILIENDFPDDFVPNKIPLKPSKPVEPEKYIFDKLNYTDKKVSELISALNTYPEKVSVKTLLYTLSQFDEECQIEIIPDYNWNQISIYEKIKNPNYDSELEKFNNKLAIYEQELEVFKKAFEEYSVLIQKYRKLAYDKMNAELIIRNDETVKKHNENFMIIDDYLKAIQSQEDKSYDESGS